MKVVTVDVLWICDWCQSIGSEAQARAHRIARGHSVEALNREMTDAIFAEWRRVGDPRAVVASGGGNRENE